MLNMTKQKTTLQSPISLLIGSETTTPLIRNVVRDVAIGGSNPNRQKVLEMRKQAASERLKQNQKRQGVLVNKNRQPPFVFNEYSLVFVIKKDQSTEKLDSGMRGPHGVVKVLPQGRYELQLLANANGKTTQAAPGSMVLWKGEWTPDSCSAFFESECTCLNTLIVIVSCVINARALR